MTTQIIVNNVTSDISRLYYTIKYMDG